MGSADVWNFARVNWLFGFHKANKRVQRASEKVNGRVSATSAKMPYKSTSHEQICLFYRN